MDPDEYRTCQISALRQQNGQIGRRITWSSGQSAWRPSARLTCGSQAETRSHHWYDCGVSESLGTEKLSATVPKGLAAEVRERAGRGNVSAYVTNALLLQLEHDRLGDLVAELEQVHGLVSDEELAAARSEWP
jgi:hypothetical protein